MIHAYVLILHRKADRDDHGPLFQAEMNRLNATAGTHITIYHSFFDEVDYYRNHWWKCSKCSQTVKRSMNRAPGKHDRWWNSHESKCGGQFIKTKEPDDYKSKKSKKSQTPKSNVNSNPQGHQDIKKFFPGLGKRIRPD